MALPPSLGDPDVSAAQLLAESFALEKPFGVPVLALRPEAFEAIAYDPQAFKAQLEETYESFLTKASGGDALQKQELAEQLAKLEYIPEKLGKSAGNPDYPDAHAGWLTGEDGGIVAGIMVASRENLSFSHVLKNLTDVDGQQFATPSVPMEQMQFMTFWHEAGHFSGGAKEAQAETMAAIMARKAFPGSPVVQMDADMRALDALFTFGDERRQQNYGWQVVEALDAVIAMPESEIKTMGEQGIIAQGKKEPAGPSAALVTIGSLITGDGNERLLDAKKLDLRETAGVMRHMLESGAFGAECDETHRVAARCLGAMERLTGMQPYPSLNNDGAASPGPAAQGPKQSAFAR